MLSRIALLLLVVSLVANGCRRRSTANGIPQTPIATDTSVEQPAAIAPAAKPNIPPPVPGSEKIADKLPTAPPNASKTSPIDQPLTEALHRFFEANNRMPSDFDELVRAKFIPALPPPPAGKRYAIDRPNMQVVLISQ